MKPEMAQHVSHRTLTVDGVSIFDAYRRDVPTAEVHVLDAGHFVLDTTADKIAVLVGDFVPPS